MVIKERFELIPSKTGNVYNILPINENTLNAFEIDSDDILNIRMLGNSFGKTHPSYKYIFQYINNCKVVKLENYPLPGGVINNNIPFINVSVLTSEVVSDYTTQDIYSMYLYAISLAIYFKNKPFKQDSERSIIELLFKILIVLFAKTSGLLGAHRDKIMILQVLCDVYVRCSMFGNPLTKSIIETACARYFVNINLVKIDESILTTIGFLKLLKSNGVMIITENVLNNKLINVSSLSSIPIMEDVSRLYSTMLATTVSGSTVFSKFWKKRLQQTFDKIAYDALNSLRGGI